MTTLAPPLCALHLSRPRAVLIRGTRLSMSSCTPSATLEGNSTCVWVPHGSFRLLLFAFLNDLDFAMIRTGSAGSSGVTLSVLGLPALRRHHRGRPN